MDVAEAHDEAACILPPPFAGEMLQMESDGRRKTNADKQHSVEGDDEEDLNDANLFQFYSDALNEDVQYADF